jgi:DNA-binding NarL/FixJ family response regulator
MRLALEPDITVVGEASDGLTGLSMAATLRPDVVVMDVEMPGMDGLTATAALRAVAPDIPVVAISVNDEGGARRLAQEAGVAAFIGKHSCGEDLLAAIRQVARRATWQVAEHSAPPKDGGADGPFVRFKPQGYEV